MEPINISNDLYRVAIEDDYILIETRAGRPILFLDGADLRLYDAPSPNQRRGLLTFGQYAITAGGIEPA